MRRRKSASLLALLLAVCLMLGACSGDKQSSHENDDILLPEPDSAAVSQILGESARDAEYDVTLHYASEDSLSLGTMARRLTLKQNEDLLQVLLEELMTTAALSGSVEAELTDLESGAGVVTVNLSLEAGVNRSEQDYLLLCASIANTLLELKGVDVVNVLTGGRSDPLCSLPLGVFTAIQDNIAAAYAQVQSESERASTDNGAEIRRNAALYFPAQDGEYLLAEVRELTFGAEDAAQAVLQALDEGPQTHACCFSALPQGSDLLLRAPEILVSDAGERILELRFDSALSNYLEVSGVEEWQLYASLALSLCSFVPEIDALRVYIGEEAVQGCSMRSRILNFENALMRRSDFSSAIGGSARLYFAGSEGKLAAAELPLAQSEAASPLRLLNALIEAQAPEGLASVFPQGISGGDVLGVSIENRTATVNLSANFYARCQELSAQQERQLIYAMVNTLTQLEEIGAVAFLVEGRQTPSLAQDIYLKTPLLPDPGLAQ